MKNVPRPYLSRLRLADILVRPMQRLTKYTLLLTAIRKHITDENDAEIMDAMVDPDFIFGLNGSQCSKPHHLSHLLFRYILWRILCAV